MNLKIHDGKPKEKKSEWASKKNNQLQSSIEIAKVLIKYYYINKLISYKPDFRFYSNFAGAVYLLPSTCIPNIKKIHKLLLPFAYVNCLSPSNILLHK